MRPNFAIQNNETTKSVEDKVNNMDDTGELQ